VVDLEFDNGGDCWTKIDGKDYSAPYCVTWDTTCVEDGVYLLKALAADKAGNISCSYPVCVTVDNTPPPKPCRVTPEGGEAGESAGNMKFTWDLTEKTNLERDCSGFDRALLVRQVYAVITPKPE
jgi:hypothetical protein